jgi:hypothetical protein
MAITGVLVLVVGMLVGLSYRVLAIIPVSFVYLALIVAENTGQGRGFWASTVAIVAGLVCLQLGYLAGGAISTFATCSRDAAFPRPRTETKS